MAEAKKTSYVVTLTEAQGAKLKHILEERDLTFTQPPHTHFSAKKSGLSCTLYLSGKLVVQGKELEEFITFTLEPEVLGSFTYHYAEEARSELQEEGEPHIGVDESGKGDYFGPLCAAAVFADKEQIAQLVKMGVQDSKKLTDARAHALSKEIKKVCTSHTVRISPTRYNELYEQFNNLNRLLAWSHATVIEALVQETGCTEVIVDQFAAEHVVETALKRKKLDVQLRQRHRAEEDVVVAAASIVARAAFLEGLERLGKEHGVTLPKGASAQVTKVGKELVAKYGGDMLGSVAKLHFKTTERIL